MKYKYISKYQVGSAVRETIEARTLKDFYNQLVDGTGLTSVTVNRIAMFLNILPQLKASKEEIQSLLADMPTADYVKSLVHLTSQAWFNPYLDILVRPDTKKLLASKYADRSLSQAVCIYIASYNYNAWDKLPPVLAQAMKKELLTIDIVMTPTAILNSAKFLGVDAVKFLKHISCNPKMSQTAEKLLLEMDIGPTIPTRVNKL